MTQARANLRQQLLDTGMKLLSEQGYDGTGLKEILDQVSDYSRTLLELMDRHLAQGVDSPRETIRQLYRMEPVTGCMLLDQTRKFPTS